MQNKLMRFLLFFLIFLVVFQFFAGNRQKGKSGDDIELAARSKFTIGKEVQIQIKNHKEEAVAIPSSCPKNPLTVERYQNGEWAAREVTIDPAKCDQFPVLTIEPGKTGMVSYGPWNHELFNEEGKYRISLVTEASGKEKVYSRELEIKKAGALQLFWNHFLYRPIFNTLIFLVSIMPGHSLGWGIILLTVLIKLILLGPNQKALRSQKAMQRLQPELDALKTKYKDDQQRLAQETMALWKKHKVSPMGSCLPLLIQFPILIALFYVVKDGLNITNPEVFYSSLKSFDLKSIDVIFAGILDLTKNNVIALPLVVGGLQFFQMHLTFSKIKTPEKGGINPLPMMNQMMKYMMPAMIAVFTAGLPAAVGFYWGTSTLFGIGQQLVVNKMKD
ncbi:MAG: YidC/Oxa1 family membrane protein insertase [Candidatus Peregrinibacteria bacterium]